MLYIVIGVLLINIILIFNNKGCNKNTEENILEDISGINISKEELEKHAVEISNYPVTNHSNCKKKLIKSLDISYKKILQGYEYIDETLKEKKEVTPASEWLLDNLYLIEKEYKHIKYNMPKSYYENLPVITKGIMKGYPRIYHISVEIVSHINCKIDESILEGFIKSYQVNSVLTNGEIWALPIMLRIALIQNISKITEELVRYSKERIKADVIADKIINAVHDKNSIYKINNIVKENIKFSTQFSERLLKILRDNGVENKKINQWILDKMESTGGNSQSIINSEHIKQASQQFVMGNSIDSIREVESLNWRELFEKMSITEKCLKEDPVGIYSKMDFESRDYYRHQIESLSKKLKKSEVYIAKQAIECAKDAASAHKEEYKSHVGYYITDKGVKVLKNRICNKNKFKYNNCEGRFKNQSVKSYIVSIVILTAILIGVFLELSYINDNEKFLWKYVVATIALLVPCSEIVISILNWIITKTIKPKFIPKMDLSEGIGEENRTIVVVPTIISNEKRAEELIRNLEVFYLANRDKNIYFAILSDFKDSNKEKEKQDEKIIKESLKYISSLNKKYCEHENSKFYFFSRERQFNEKENKWIGWERKRGKLVEFNHLIRGDENTSYNVISSDIKELTKAKYIITLDSDTELPRNSAKKLIGAMSHILNRACIDKNRKRVIRGYGIMQPKISINMLSSSKTLFSKIFSGESGIDIYTTAVSDVYQDAFGEGIFTGKGIYDIDVFNYMLEGEIPENTVLSHDLLEGSYVRTALVTDVEFIDGYPAYFNSSSKRLHRWVRGDWQLIPWFKNKLSINALSKWKMLDNLRRSLLSPSIVILIALSFSVLPDGTDKWIVAAILALITPLIFDITENIASPIREISLSGKIKNRKTVIEQIFLIICFLPFNAYLMIDAILRTLYRLKISKKHLLEWQTADDVEKKSGKNISDYIKLMWPGSLISIIIFYLAFRYSKSVSSFIIPISILWFISPIIAWKISTQSKKVNYEIDEENKEVLRRLSRKTWAYFDDFVNDENNWLAPDNYQEEPFKGVAHRTSPTNIAMGLTSNLVACDLGYIDISESVDRIHKIIENMNDLEKYRGHFYNWYDTCTKEPLNPKYISTVDSGNLVGYLWVVAETMKEYLNEPYLNERVKEGIKDTLSLANEEIYLNLGINDFYLEDINNINQCQFSLNFWINFLNNISNKFIIIEENTDNELYWNNKLKHDVKRYLYDVKKIIPSLDNIDKDILKILTRVPINKIPRLLDNMKTEKEMMYLKNSSVLENIKNIIEHLIQDIQSIIHECSNMVENTDFKMLYDNKKGLFAIGYDVNEDSLGKCYYDLLASEARQASFVAIAKGDVDTRHWFRLGRSMALIGINKGLVSWSGTMFEYLMPLLIMNEYPETILSETYKSIVIAQKKYGKLKNVPWGISESAYRAFDVSMNYQYKAFGVPGIGLKRGLKDELVISPYSTVMALQVDLKSSIDNINRFIKEGVEGRYGLYEAIDYTKYRLPKNIENSIVKCFMVHHQGMSLMALDNVINENIFRKRFHNNPKVKSAELLLQEKVPNRVVYERQGKFEITERKEDKPNIISRRFTTSKTEIPKVQLMSNGTYSMMITNSGSGYGKREEMTIYRCKKDVTLDSSGMFFYIKDIKNNHYWSATYEPCKKENDSYEVIFSQYKAEFKKVEENVVLSTEVTVSNEDNTEIRRISLTNNGESPKTLEITSYCEVTLSPFDADIVHPAFSNLFIRTEFLQDLDCVIANRRPRAKGQNKPHVMQCVAIEGGALGNTQCETSRVNFIGRDRNLINPIAMEQDMPLKNSEGAVLDPIISIRKRVTIPPGKTCRIAFTTAITDSRDDSIKLAEKYRDFINVDRAFELAYNQHIVDMRYLGLKSPQINLYEELASKILFINDSYKDREEYVKNIKRGQQSLWKYGISGDLPIILVIIKEENEIDLVRQILNAHEYLEKRGLRIDLIILNLQDSTYTQPLQDALRKLIDSNPARSKQNISGGVFLNTKSTFEEEDIKLLMGISRIVLYGEKGTLSNQISEKPSKNEEENISVMKKRYSYETYDFSVNTLEYYNDIGGFDLENNEYTIILDNGKTTPAPWINVIGNKNFGFIVSESGSPYTWFKNSRENKITTWSNDWVSDPPSEVIYIRDEESGDTWSITPEPIRDNEKYIIRHGFGYSKFQHQSFGIAGEVTMFVPMNENVKICKIKLINTSNINRKLSLTYYAQLVLGVVPQKTNIHIATYLNKEKKYIYGNNPYSYSFGNLKAYLKIIGGNNESFTGSRTEFIGRGESIENPKALKKVKLSNDVGAGMDPCLAENVKVSINKGEEKTLFVVFGEDQNLESIEKIIDKYDKIDTVEEELKNTKDYWSKLLNTIKVNTPDETMNLMLNGWLLYQTIVCRIWARSAFYQSGGAFGFRDQLQDVMAAGYLNSEFMRDHILYSATRQFTEGDVQHWWHPIVDSGIRTRFSDDLLWLPYVTIDYIKRTGDYSILDEEVYYLEDRPLEEGEDERYTISRQSQEKGTIYEHCIKAIERGLHFGAHNIPLMGSGDWNDGMSEVGNKGTGESVWLGWFLYSILDGFQEISEFKNDKERAERYKDMQVYLKENLNKNAWDGSWYRRAYFDDGAPLGSIENDECKIDSLAQSWAVISGAGDKDKINVAMESLEKYLVKEDTGMVLLLTPPFESSVLEPGYIKGYVPGVRENGGQYTHASTWVVLAMAMLGEGDKAWKIFNMLNPINHTKSYSQCEKYKVEPYVITADIYGREPYTGRGGWSWYTGAAGWMYRVALEGILGLKFKGNKGFVIEPSIPKEWNGFEIEYNKDNCKYDIKVVRGEDEKVIVDGKKQNNNIIPFLKSGVHDVKVVIKKN